MHKCNNCGHEFEGKFCPECGARADGGEKEPSAVKAFFKKFWTWVKSHKKIVIPVSAFIVVAVVLLSLIPTFILASKNGTYYAYNPYSDKVDKESYIVLTTGKWKDEDGESGTYKVKGDKVIFYMDKEELFTGTLKNGVLKYGEKGAEEVFVSDKHKHSFGGWKDKDKLTCTQDATQTGICACGKTSVRITTKADGHKGDWTVIKEPACTETGTRTTHCSVCNQDVTESIEMLEHAFEYIFDLDTHYKFCSVCGESTEKEAHTGEGECTVCTFPLDETEGNFIYTLNSDNTGYSIEIGYYDAYTKPRVIIIPDMYKNLPVTAIDKRAFDGRDYIEYVYIPGSVTSIGDYAFDDCSGLKSVSIPDSVTDIGNYAFSGCSGLKKVSLPGNIMSLGDGLFAGCTGLTAVTIPDGVKYLGSAFAGCSGLTSIIIPDSVTKIAEGAFAGCSGLTSFTIPDSVTSIEYNTFSGCSGLTNIIIPDSVTSISSAAFDGCTNLIQTENGVRYVEKWIIGCDKSVTRVTLRTDTKGIAEWAFKKCSGLAEIIIPASVKNIGYDAFSECSGLKSVTIIDGVKSVDGFAFYNCSGLISITIPVSVTSIGRNAFGWCTELANITYNGTKAQWKAIWKADPWYYFGSEFIVHCTDGNLNQYDSEIE